MKVFLDSFLPRTFPDLPFLCVPHDGKQDLEQSIPRKLRAWKEPGVHFVVVRDNDGGDCQALKANLVKVCQEGRRDDAVVRIACQELEAWYFGDLTAVAEEFDDDRLRDIGEKARFRVPDDIVQPARALEELIPAFQKVTGARRMAARIRLESNSSRSFQVFVNGVERLAAKVRMLAGQGV